MQPIPIAIGWTIAAALLLVEHVALWAQPWRLDPPWTYVIGVATLFIGWAAWGMTAAGPVSPLDAVVNISLVSTSGAVVALAYYVRDRQARAAGHAAIVQQARAFTQAIIDDGGHRDQESGLADPGRRN